MLSRRSLVVATAALAMAMAMAMGMTGAAQAAPAPAFNALNADGKPVSLAEFKGRTVVLEWANSGCPYVGKHYGTHNMQDTQAFARGAGVVWLTVMSSAPGQQGHLTGAEARSWMKQAGGSASDIILDPKGELARLYGAKTTPDMRVIDGAGQLVYQGGIDDKPTANWADLASAHNLVRAALTDMAAHRPVAVTYAKPYGCSIKFANS